MYMQSKSKFSQKNNYNKKEPKTIELNLLKQGQTVHRSEALNFNVERMKWRRQNDICRKEIRESKRERANNKGNRLRCIFCFSKDILKPFYPHKWQMTF